MSEPINHELLGSRTVRIEPVILFVSKLEECVEFYRDVMGLKLKSARKGHDGFVGFDAVGFILAPQGCSPRCPTGMIEELRKLQVET